MPSPRTQSGYLVQSRFGTPENFELVVPSAVGGLMHHWRDNSMSSFPWRGPNYFGGERPWTSASLIQSSLGPSDLELIGLQDGRLAHFWRWAGSWNGPALFGTGHTGNPAFIQSTFGRNGNFEVVVPNASGGLSHYFRNNDPIVTAPWTGPIAFGSGNVRGVAMIQGNFGGNFEVVAVEDDRLVFYWRDGSGWNGPFTIGTGVTGRPSLIQSTFGTRGNFEVIVPSVGGGLAHYWRNNDDPSLPWFGPFPFGSGTIGEVSCIQSSFGPGNLEVVAREGNRLAFYWRVNGPPWTWSGPFYICEETVTLHFKNVVDPATFGVPVSNMLDQMRIVYETAGLRVNVASTETLSLPSLIDVNVNCSGIGFLDAEQDALFANRNSAGPRDLCIYFVRSTLPPLNGCAAHPAGRPGAIVCSVASPWTLGHEVGHVLGLGHVGPTDRLMVGSGTWGITNPPPDLVQSEVSAMRGSDLTA